ncbi:MAG: hypothetical protein SGI96_21285 [Bacteroidota bacterium]|nr:hypothetical protein [Bacteroidota bacterium]
MEDLQKDIENDLKGVGIRVIEKEEFDLPKDTSMKVNCFVDIENNPGLEGLIFEKTTKRGSKVFVYSFSHADGCLKFSVGTKPHKSFLETYEFKNNSICMAFMDFCWVLSDGTTNESAQENKTRVDPSLKLGDLTWCLPSKFADDVIDVIGLLNVSVLSGIMENSFLYGPIFEKNIAVV